MVERIDVMISSTARDLPRHREQAKEACLRQGMFPIMMENLPASDDEAISASLKMVEEAEIYLGIFAYRYGYVPAGYDISVTEMEYDHAVAQGIPRLIFIMSENHPIKGSDVETGAGAIKLRRFKERLMTGNIVNFFESPEDFRAHAINALSEFRQPDSRNVYSTNLTNIPPAPEPYIAHPYTLLQTNQLVGRSKELNLLTDWVTQVESVIYRARILNVVAIGGMGKSALTWKWFNDIAPNEMHPIRGRMWWSFYETDARFENFVTRALIYVSEMSLEEVEGSMSFEEREQKLLEILDKEPFLLVLDGLERLLTAYSQIDTALISDEELDVKTGNFIASELTVSTSKKKLPTMQHRLRRTIDPRVGNFLKKLAQIRSGRILVSTRLYPADLQTVTGRTMPGSAAYFLKGLEDDDALRLWRAFGVSGSRNKLLPMFHSFDNYPLLIRALAGEVSRFRRKPGDFDVWEQHNPDFNPLNLPLENVKSHVLHYALRGIDSNKLQVLHIITGFHMACKYDMLVTLVVDVDKLYQTEDLLDQCLTELEDRGLLGWDKLSNRYFLHPIVRGIVSSSFNEETKSNLYKSLNWYFQSFPSIDESQVQSIDDMNYVIEHYYVLIRLGRLYEAYLLFRNNINYITLHILFASYARIEMLQMLFPEDDNSLPLLKDPRDQSFVLGTLAATFRDIGNLKSAIALYESQIDLAIKSKDTKSASIAWSNLSVAWFWQGRIYQAEYAVKQSIRIAEHKRWDDQITIGLQRLGMILYARGDILNATNALQTALQKAYKINRKFWLSRIYIKLSQGAIWEESPTKSLKYAQLALETAQTENSARDIASAERLLGFSYLLSNVFAESELHLSKGLSYARKINFTLEELFCLIGLGVLDVKRDNTNLVRLKNLIEFHDELLSEFPLLKADTLNWYADIISNPVLASTMAVNSFHTSWCNGKPYYYHWGLEKSKNILDKHDHPYPSVPEEDDFEMMPEIKSIN